MLKWSDIKIHIRNPPECDIQENIKIHRGSVVSTVDLRAILLRSGLNHPKTMAADLNSPLSLSPSLSPPLSLPLPLPVSPALSITSSLSLSLLPLSLSPLSCSLSLSLSPLFSFLFPQTLPIRPSIPEPRKAPQTDPEWVIELRLKTERK